MKTKTILLTVITLCLLIGGAGCEKAKYEIYENHEITACGVKDPLNNLKWLKDYCESHSKWYSANIFIYKNNTSDINNIIIETNTRFNASESPSTIFAKYIYSCEGDILMFYGTEGPKPDGWDNFFEENKEIAKVWSVKEVIN